MQEVTSHSACGHHRVCAARKNLVCPLPRLCELRGEEVGVLARVLQRLGKHLLVRRVDRHGGRASEVPGKAVDDGNGRELGREDEAAC